MLLFSWLSPLKRARRAAKLKDWAAAARAYQKHLLRNPRDDGAWVQFGHSLKEHGHLKDAASAYREATQIAPHKGDGWIHLAHLERRNGNREGAILTLQEVLNRTNEVESVTRAVREMVEMGARERLPLANQLEIEAQEGCYTTSRYNYYHALQEKTNSGQIMDAPSDFLVIIDCRHKSTELVSITCRSLEPSGNFILADDAMAQCLIDEGAASNLLLVEAGTLINLDAITRLCAAMQTTDATAAYCDHDHWSPVTGNSKNANAADEGIVRFDPCFQPMYDPVWFRRTEVHPPCILIRKSVLKSATTWAELLDQRLYLPGRYAHVPLVLASRYFSESLPKADSKSPVTPDKTDKIPIQVIIQTRDAPDMLQRCVTSLLRTANCPNELEILIVDNRSVLAETTDLLREWSSRKIARIMPHDEPFNWARANNLAVQQTRAHYLLFLNNDVEMQSYGWDDEIRCSLAQEEVGAMGALLLYPNQLIQHAGVIIGMGSGGAVHEGVGHSLHEGGPSKRWQHPRNASAVTGAWLATTRTLFEKVGGFEERLPVGYNDIDFSLRCRAAGRFVVQASQIVAIHLESATRGSVMSQTEHERDRADWAWMRMRWGETLDRDPAYNPNWARSGQPFNGMCAPSEEVQSRWTENSARVHPWSVPPPFHI